MPALESRLTLVAWFAKTLGYRNNADMLKGLQFAADGWGADGRNYVLQVLRGTEHGIPAATWNLLEELDAEIQADWDAINRNRQTPLSLKYFQYLACLSSAYYLRRLADDPDALTSELRKFSCSEGLENLDQHSIDKLAFWMATGSGKTLLMHMHYRQFLRYKHAFFAPDNILLITPNEELSRQHLTEMQASNISCFLHGESSNLLSNKDAVRIVEITKLVDENGNGRRGNGRKGKGKSVATEAFSGRNVVFVDEGHKGSGGEAWFDRRDKLTENGFAFEYSATFGQALGAADRDARTAEYARTIAFDYSYQYFYRDGYGKDFSILSISDDDFPNPDETSRRDLLMLGNLLAFFQQQWAFANNETEWLPYRMEKPLLLLLGATVTGNPNRAQTDMVSTIAFLQRAVADKNENGDKWLEKAVSDLLKERSGITTDNGVDAFVGKFAYLKEEFGNDKKLDAKALCRELRKTLFYANAPGALRFRLLKQTKGERSEICLQVGDNSEPFGLIYVGSPSKLRDLVKEQVTDVEVSDDAVRKPLFADTHKPESPINILIGARKFMEGWSSWRVCGMGLMNIGRSEGAQIIQLFGRGVRLRGKNFSLKRSAALQRDSMDKPPPNLKLLETLNIFAIRADFMRQFRDYLEREGMAQTFTLPLMMNPAIKQGKVKLQTLKMPLAEEFHNPVPMAMDENLTIKLEMRVKMQAIESGSELSLGLGNMADSKKTFVDDDDLMSLLDLDDLYRKLLEYKRNALRKNLLLSREELPEILGKCEIYTSDGLNPHSYEGVRRLQRIAFSALRKYADRLYYREQRKWETAEAEYMPLLEQVGEQKMEYTISLRADADRQKIEQIQRCLEANRPYFTDEGMPLPRMGGRSSWEKEPSVQIHFDEHIYIPLLFESLDSDISISPPGLTKSEIKFAKDLHGYLRENPLPKGRDIFLLRNESKGRGMGFYESEGFYPDFMLWIADGKKQRIVFVEPHGMVHAPAYEKDFKARLWKMVQEQSEELHKKNKAWKDITMDSYVISGTSFNDLKKTGRYGDWNKDDFIKNHILFAEDGVKVIDHIVNQK